MDWRQVFATNLIRARRRKGLSQETLAYVADVNRSYINKLEKGSTYVGLKIIVKLAKALDVEPGAFLERPARKSRKTT